jgi:hypothetical protein
MSPFWPLSLTMAMIRLHAPAVSAVLRWPTRGQALGWIAVPTAMLPCSM